MIMPIVFLFLAGLTAVGFLEVVRRRREMPPLLRTLLIVAAVGILLFVVWAFAAILKLL
jgi:hypothetical protein